VLRRPHFVENLPQKVLPSAKTSAEKDKILAICNSLKPDSRPKAGIKENTTLCPIAVASRLKNKIQLFIML